MILILEYLSIWFGLALIVGLSLGPVLKRRFAKQEEWFTAPSHSRDEPSVTPHGKVFRQ